MSAVVPAPRRPRIHELGDCTLLVELGSRLDTAINTRAHRMAAALRKRPGVIEAVAGCASVTVHHDPDRVTAGSLAKLITALASLRGGAPASDRLHRIPVTYDGPDLATTAAELRLSVDELIARHTAPYYRAFMAGFLPGWAYLGPLPPELHIPRLATPRTLVPAGSVAIAGEQTGIYPLASPGGWRLLGRTAVPMFLADSEPPLLLRPGDRVRFFAL